MLHERIEQIRKERGWSRSHLAKVAGVDRSSLQRFLVGERGLRSYDLERVLAALNLTIEETS
jgi:transcriptional regulator with XRE-family HTH domain